LFWTFHEYFFESGLMLKQQNKHVLEYNVYDSDTYFDDFNVNPKLFKMTDSTVQMVVQ